MCYVLPVLMHYTDPCTCSWHSPTPSGRESATYSQHLIAKMEASPLRTFWISWVPSATLLPWKSNPTMRFVYLVNKQRRLVSHDVFKAINLCNRFSYFQTLMTMELLTVVIWRSWSTAWLVRRTRQSWPQRKWGSSSAMWVQRAFCSLQMQAGTPDGWNGRCMAHGCNSVTCVIAHVCLSDSWRVRHWQGWNREPLRVSACHFKVSRFCQVTKN